MLRRFEISEIFLLTAGLIMLASLPFLQYAAKPLWIVAKSFYLAGVVLFLMRK